MTGAGFWAIASNTRRLTHNNREEVFVERLGAATLG